jgi:hypothetical protein
MDEGNGGAAQSTMDSSAGAGLRAVCCFYSLASHSFVVYIVYAYELWYVYWYM